MTTRGSRGYSLLELLIALVISLVVVAAALALMNAQQRSYRSGSDERQIQEAGRVAVEEITSNLRMAGYGVDPVLAFDFGAVADAGMAQAPTGLVAPTTGFQCAAPVTCRDRIDGPDEIVFRSRDPGFGHRFTRVPGTDSITVNGPLGADLQAGQVLQIACYTSPMTWAYVTVAATVVANPAAAEVAIALRAGNGNTFPLQNDWVKNGPCFSTVAPPGSAASAIEGAAKVFKIDTYRYYVQVFGVRPYLMLDQGFAEATVVAPDVEDLQFTYVFPNSPGGAQRLGDTPGVALGAGDIDLAPADGLVTFGTPGDSPARRTYHPANIRMVRVSAVVRAPFPATSGTYDTIPAAGNRPELVGQPNYRRFLLESSATTRNLDSRAPFFPAWSAGVDPVTKVPLDTLNQGGG
jgi:type IV pilus assembly protein PilW